jgi:hypothetical protein
MPYPYNCPLYDAKTGVVCPHRVFPYDVVPGFGVASRGLKSRCQRGEECKAKEAT